MIRVIEKEDHLFVNLVEYFVDTRAQRTSETEPIQFTDNILIQAYNGKIEEEQMGEKCGLDCLFLIQEVIFIANVKAFHTKKCNE